MPLDLTAVTRQLSPIHLRSVVEATGRINIWQGSVRSGKTVASLLRFLIAVANAPSSGRILIFGKTRETVGRNVFAVLQDPALFGPLARLVKYNPGSATGTILGRVVDVLGANDAKSEPKVRGMTLCLAYGDELTTIPEEFFIQVLARLSVKGAQLLGTTNPDGPMHWLRQRFLLRQGEIDLRTWHSTLDDNPHLDPEYVRNLKIEYTGLWYRRFISGEWCLAEGAIYDMWDPDRHVVDQLPHMSRWLGLGVDYGTTNPFAGLLLSVGDAGDGAGPRLYLSGEWRWDQRRKMRKLTDAEYARHLIEWVDGYQTPGGGVGVRPEWTIVDPSAASFVLELQRSGRLTPTLADNSVVDGIRTVASLLALDLLRVHRSCKGLIDEIPGYSWDDEKALKGLDEPVKVDDHSCDAARYVIHTVQASWRPLLRRQLALAT